jgi:PilZ domain
MLATKHKREPRRARQHAAWITFEDDFISHDCQILDVSLNGAKLTADIAVAIGSRFRLSAVPHALVRQQCEVIWRRGSLLPSQVWSRMNAVACRIY